MSTGDARDALERLVRWVLRDTLYHAQYDATVQRQHSDGTIDLLPDDERVRGSGLSRIPIRHGLPAVEVRVLVGSRVLLGFANGDPRRPYASLWDASSIESVSFNGGEAPIARKGDPVVVTWPAVDVMGTIPSMPGSSFAGTIPAGTQSPGLISTGAPRVKA